MTSSSFGGVGRPSHAELDRQRREFVRLIATGQDFDAAARDARIKPVRALAILSEPEMRQVIAQTHPKAA